MAAVNSFARRVVDWQRKHGRHGLPWQGTGDPYRVWLSEIMLQQTQVTTVLPYYSRFLQRYPNVRALAAADETELMGLWAGLGYYARARNLLACAKQVVKDHGGQFPESVEALCTLPGIGESTAGAVLSLSGKGVAAILDGNVRRVFARYFGIHGFTGLPAVQARMWSLARDLVPGPADVLSYNQGLMDLGAGICTRNRPRCADCPLQADCIAKRENLTAVLPTPKPPAVRKTEHYAVTLRVSNAGLWLAPRPARGIWSGLWMAPMQLLTADEVPDAAPAVVHELTHRRYCLHVTVLSDTESGESSLSDGKWFALPLGEDAPVPAALHRLLDAVRV